MRAKSPADILLCKLFSWSVNFKCTLRVCHPEDRFPLVRPHISQPLLFKQELIQLLLTVNEYFGDGKDADIREFLTIYNSFILNILYLLGLRNDRYPFKFDTSFGIFNFIFFLSHLLNEIRFCK